MVLPLCVKVTYPVNTSVNKMKDILICHQRIMAIASTSGIAEGGTGGSAGTADRVGMDI